MKTPREHLDVIKTMTPDQKYQAAMGLLNSVLRMKEASLRAWRPELSEGDIKQLLRNYLLYARS